MSEEAQHAGEDVLQDYKVPEGAKAITAQLRSALRNRLDANEWVLCFEVAGFRDGVRYADAIGVNLWASKSYEVHGFEVKATRSDWLRELREGGKSDYFFCRTHRWYVVAWTGIVLKTELPKGWGLLEWNGSTLVQKVPAALREDVQIEHEFLAALIRRARDGPRRADQDDLRAAFNNGYKSAEKRTNQDVQDALRSRIREYVQMKERVEAFEKATGTSIVDWSGRLSEAARWVMRNGDPEKALREVQARVDRISKDMAAAFPGGQP